MKAVRVCRNIFGLVLPQERQWAYVGNDLMKDVAVVECARIEKIQLSYNAHDIPCNIYRCKKI